MAISFLPSQPLQNGRSGKVLFALCGHNLKKFAARILPLLHKAKLAQSAQRHQHLARALRAAARKHAAQVFGAHAARARRQKAVYGGGILALGVHLSLIHI